MSFFSFGNTNIQELLVVVVCVIFSDWSSRECTLENLKSSGTKIMMGGPIVQTNKIYTDPRR